MITSTLVTLNMPRSGQDSCSVQVIEAAGGPVRRRWLEEYIAERNARSFILSCDFESEGPWAGVKELLLRLLPEIQSQRPDLVEQHSFELTSAVPRLRKSLTAPHRTLTDVAPDEEKVRGYPADRALRNVHGLIDLIDQWKRESGESAPWIITCDDFDKAGTMSRHFFRELMRRRSAQLNLSLVVAVGPNCGAGVCSSFHPSLSTRIDTLDLPEEIPDALSQEVAAAAAAELEVRISEDPIEKENNLHKLIGLWQRARRYDKVVQLKRFGTRVYFHDGLYADALRCSDGMVEMAAMYAPDDESLHREIVIRRLNALIGLQNVAESLKLIENDALPIADTAPLQWQADLFYLTAMVYARYLKPRNLEKGEEYLDKSLEAIRQIGLSEDKYHFQYVFNRNGVAMIRSFQRRPQDAIDLCRNNLATLDAHVSPEKHKLHRSVLVYNTGQVYLAIGDYEEALRHYSAAIAMDPNFSEYYNERGSILLKLSHFEEAEADFRRAIELSPPYYEVFTNLAQCYRNMARYEEAVNSYSRALDLEPNQVLALLGRAQAYEASGRRPEAIADYTLALACDTEQWEAFANRGILYYETGDFQAALDDFDSAIGIEPKQLSLYQNRAILLAEFTRYEDATRDLETALGLCSTDNARLPLLQLLQSVRKTAAVEPTQAES